MRAILTAFLLLALAAGVQAENYKLQDHSRLILVTPGGWNQSGTDVGDLIFRFSPKNPKLNALAELTVSAGVVDEYNTPDKLSGYVANMAREMAGNLGPTMRPPAVKPLRCKQGFGYIYSIIDPSLIGKAPQPGNFKQVTGGVIRLGPGVMVEVRITSDGDETEGYQQLLAMVENLELKR